MPYADHPVFEISDSGGEIWRYVSVSQFLSLLETESLWFARADSFDDPYEGRLPQKNIDELPSAHEVELPEYLIVRGTKRKKRSDWPRINKRSVIETYRKSTFVNCWHRVEEEKDVLWRANLASGNGVVIKSTIDSLKGSLKEYQEKEIWLGEVSYIDYQNERISLQNSLAPILQKRKAFEQENEIRAVMTSFPADKHPGYEGTVPGQHLELNWAQQDIGKYIDVNVSDLIDEVRIAPTADSWLTRSLSDVVTKHGYDFAVKTSSLRTESLDARWESRSNDP